MKIEEYQEKSMRTMNWKLTSEQLLSNMILGISGETGEIADIMKKYLYQGHQLDRDSVKEELGDVMFYIANLCNVLQMDLKEIIEGNYYKLLERYPNGFEVERSVNREN